MKKAFFRKLTYLLVVLFGMVNSNCYSQLNDESVGLSSLLDHEIYIHELIQINFGNLFPYASVPIAEMNAVHARLDVADSEIGNFFSIYFGHNIGNQITLFFSQYDTFPQALINAYKINDNVAAQNIYVQWVTYAQAIAAYLHSINPLINQNLVSVYLTQLVNLETSQIIDYLEQNYNSALTNFDQARATADALGSYLGLVDWQITHP